MPTRRLIPDVVANQDLVCLSEKTRVRDAVDVMISRNIGAVLISERRILTGIFTERDVLTRVVGTDRDARELRLIDVMTRNPIRLPPSATAFEALTLMQEKAIRHLPVVDFTEVVGIVSIRDLFKTVHQNMEEILERYERMILSASMNNKQL